MFDKLRKIRQESNVKVKELAEKLGLKTEGAYYKKETGSVPFTLAEGKIIADVFNLPIEEIFFKNELSSQDKIKGGTNERFNKN